MTVLRLDRLGRNLPMIFKTTKDLEQRGIVRPLTESIDMSTVAGRRMVSILASFAQHERDSSASGRPKPGVRRGQGGSPGTTAGANRARTGR